MRRPPTEFTCVECGGIAHLISFLPEDSDIPIGTALAYRCGDCADRFDVVWEEEDEDLA